MGRKLEVELPYEDDLKLELTDVLGHVESVTDQVRWLQATGSPSVELANVFLCAAVLFDEFEGIEPIERCLYQSVVWARG